MSKFSRDKGARGEREAAQVLSEALGVPVSRAARNGLSVSDLHGLEEFSVEVKYLYETPAVNTWWRQTLEQAEKEGKIPLLMYRFKKGKWVARTGILLPNATCYDDDSWIESNVTTFAFIAQICA